MGSEDSVREARRPRPRPDDTRCNTLLSLGNAKL